jgi:hypothetical protein
MKGLLPQLFSQKNLILPFDRKEPQTAVALPPASRLSTNRRQAGYHIADVPSMLFFYRFLFNDFKSFNPLFKVLFIFPSQYLFAIGFP